jgi:hypothetical protein
VAVIRASLLLAAALLASVPIHAACVTPKLVKITTADASPGLAPDHFARKPKVLYRLGNGKIRLEEEPDPAQNLHLLIVIDAPRTWQVDLFSKQARLLIDEAESNEVHAPIFSMEGLPADIMALQFGCEQEFISHANTQHERKETKQGVALTHSLHSGDYKVSLIIREGSDRIMAAMLSKQGKVVAAIRYLGYETLETVPEGLFAPPPGVNMEPAPPAK